MILAMHGGFAFLEVGSVRRKNQVNALNKIICEWSFSTLIYFLIGYPIARGVSLLIPSARAPRARPSAMGRFLSSRWSRQ